MEPDPTPSASRRWVLVAILLVVVGIGLVGVISVASEPTPAVCECG